MQTASINTINNSNNYNNNIICSIPVAHFTMIHQISQVANYMLSPEGGSISHQPFRWLIKTYYKPLDVIAYQEHREICEMVTRAEDSIDITKWGDTASGWPLRISQSPESTHQIRSIVYLGNL